MFGNCAPRTGLIKISEDKNDLATAFGALVNSPSEWKEWSSLWNCESKKPGEVLKEGDYLSVKITILFAGFPLKLPMNFLVTRIIENELFCWTLRLPFVTSDGVTSRILKTGRCTRLQVQNNQLFMETVDPHAGILSGMVCLGKSDIVDGYLKLARDLSSRIAFLKRQQAL